MSYLDHTTADGEHLKVPYLSPQTFVRHLLEKTPELVWGGFDSIEMGRRNLESFWEAYKAMHPSHAMYQEESSDRKFNNTLVFAFHGDEGRGLRKGNTALMTIESVLGIGGSPCEKVHASPDDQCNLDEAYARYFGISPTFCPHSAGQGDDGNMCDQQRTNMKQHAFLTKFVVTILPHTYFKGTNLLEIFFEKFANEFYQLFHTGIDLPSGKWYASLVGYKGDLKWFEKFKLTRCFNRHQGVDLGMCHECGAGESGQDMEDSNHVPCWANSVFTTRPYSEDNVPSFVTVPFDKEAPERILRRDLFHCSKIGVLRDFVGSCIVLICRWGYFSETTDNSMAALLDRSYHHFVWFCKTCGRTPALHGFSKAFLNYPTHASYPWINAKASDTVHLVAWIRVLAGSLLADLRDPAHKPALERILSAAKSVQGWQKIIYSHHLWLTRGCAATLYQHVHAFLKSYNYLAFDSLYNWKYTLFSLKPKFHLLCHTKFEVFQSLQDPRVKRVLNPGAFSVDTNEDMVGRLSRLMRRVGQQMPVQRCLHLYLTKSKLLHRRWRAVKKGNVLSKAKGRANFRK